MTPADVWPSPTDDSIRARIARAMSPGASYCLRCGMPWSRVTGHNTQYTETSGCFPLCEDCWQMLGHPEARIGYYATLLDLWESHHPVEPEVRSAIGRAVANEEVTR